MPDLGAGGVPFDAQGYVDMDALGQAAPPPDAVSRLHDVLVASPLPDLREGAWESMLRAATSPDSPRVDVDLVEGGEGGAETVWRGGGHAHDSVGAGPDDGHHAGPAHAGWEAAHGHGHGTDDGWHTPGHHAEWGQSGHDGTTGGEAAHGGGDHGHDGS